MLQENEIQESFSFDLQDYAPQPEKSEKPAPEKKEGKAKLAEQKNPEILGIMAQIEAELEKGKKVDFVVAAAKNPATGHCYNGKQGDFLSIAANILDWPTEYAGFKQWIELGRKVKKGEKAIAILMPCFKKGEDGEQELSYYRRVSIFNKSQTEAVN